MKATTRPSILLAFQRTPKIASLEKESILVSFSFCQCLKLGCPRKVQRFYFRPGSFSVLYFLYANIPNFKQKQLYDDYIVSFPFIHLEIKLTLCLQLLGTVPSWNPKSATYTNISCQIYCCNQCFVIIFCSEKMLSNDNPSSTFSNFIP